MNSRCRVTILKDKIKDLNLSIRLFEKHNRPNCNVIKSYKEKLQAHQKELALSLQAQ